MDSIILFIDGIDRIQLPYMLEIEPIAYNNTMQNALIEYPDSSKNEGASGKTILVQGTNIPVKTSFISDGKITQTAFHILKPGLTLLGEIDPKSDQTSKGFHIEVALVGLKGSGKTTFLTTMAKEAAKKNSFINLVPNFDDKIIRDHFEVNENAINTNSFPPSTLEEQFDCYNFQTILQNKEFALIIKDIAGEYFGPEHEKMDLEFCEKANEHLQNSDYILITIDTAPANWTGRDNQNLILLRNLYEKDNTIPNRIRVLFTKTDESSLNASNIEEWLDDKMPKTGSFLISILKVDLRQFYYISIGKVDGTGKIANYSPQHMLDPILDIIKNW